MPWLWGTGLRQRRGLSSGQGLCLGPRGPEKALAGWEGELRLNAAGRALECLWPWKLEDRVQDLSKFPGSEWAGEMLDAFLLILHSWRVPPPWPLFFHLSIPPMPLGPMRPEGAPESRGPDLEAQKASLGPIGWDKHLLHLP